VRRAPGRGCLLACLLVCAGPRPAFTQWRIDGVPLCTAPRAQTETQIASDGAGGAIVVWRDYRDGESGLYAQHIDASGAVDPTWPPNGIALCGLTSAVRSPVIVSDGATGAIVAWYDFRSGAGDIFAAHVTTSGVDPTWPVNGLTLCAAPSTQEAPAIVGDGASGAIVAWEDLRSGNWDVYAQHALAGGTADPTWPSDGRLLCTAVGDQSQPQLAADGAGGAMVAWEDDRGDGVTPHPYAQHLMSFGGLDPSWPPDGLALSTAPKGQYIAATLPDGTGGAFVIWVDLRNSEYDIYAQHALASGAIAPGWPADGVPVRTAANSQQVPAAITDGAGGVIVAWADSRNLANSYDIYAHHLLGSGVDPAWPLGGAPICSAPGLQWNPAIAPDMAGGGIVTWEDGRSSGTRSDIYAQHILSSGTVDPSWPLDGSPLCTAPRDQSAPAVASDGTGGGVVVWVDARFATGLDPPTDIYAQHVYAGGGVAAVAPGPVRGLRFDELRPNPARGAVTVRLDLPATERVSVEIFDLAGHRVRTLIAERTTPTGTLNLTWDCRSEAGSPVSSGLYFVRAAAGGRSLTRKLAIVW